MQDENSEQSLASEVHARITADFPDATINLSLDGNRAQISVVSDVFDGMSRVKKQQAVYASIADYIADGRLHAVTIDARPVDG